ncbi:MAG: hypothetical protein R3F56_11425 [Planctomycetota bacterium]
MRINVAGAEDMPAEHVMERVAENTAPASEDSSTVAPSPHSQSAPRGDASDTAFSPDPQLRTDRYRLVTPYLLRL